MALNTKSFDQIVSDQATAIQAQQPTLNNFASGSILLALIQAVAFVVMFLQNLIVVMYATARASTSTGSDLDSWMADFGQTRLPAVASSGQETFARFNPNSVATIPAATFDPVAQAYSGGTQVETADGSVVFNVIPDASNPNYVASQNAYVIALGVSIASVTVMAAAPGSAGNLVAGALNTLTSAIVGVDTVTNASPFSNGIDAETDAAFRARFQGFIQSLGQGTVAAVNQAIINLQADLSDSITEGLDYSGATDFGYFYAVIDDGSGNPSSQLIANAAAAVDLVRACGIRFGVFGPQLLTANINMAITTAAGFTHATVVAAVIATIDSYVNTLPVGVTLTYTKLSSLAYGVAGVTDVSGVTINSGTSNLVPTAKQVIKTGTVVVT